MIWSEELSASLDQASNVIVFHSAESTRTQQLAQSLADRINNLVEQNEKTLDVRLGGGGGWQERSDAQKAAKTEGGAERKGRSERSRGGTPLRGTCLLLVLFQDIDLSFHRPWRTRCQVFTGSWESHGSESRCMTLRSACLKHIPNMIFTHLPRIDHLLDSSAQLSDTISTLR